MNISVRLTTTQLDNLISLFDEHFVNAIRSGEKAQDMTYVCDMVEIYNRLKKAQAKAATSSEETDEDEVSE